MRVKVDNIIEKQGAKGTYLNITAEIEGGKKLSFNSFDKVDQTTFRQAQELGRIVELQIEKNEKGYDNLVKGSVKFLEPTDPNVKPLTQAGVKDPSPSTAPADTHVIFPESKKETKPVFKPPMMDKDVSIREDVALKAVTELMANKLEVPEDVIEMFWFKIRSRLQS